MTPERWNQIKRLFQQALELDEDRRAAFLDEACSGDRTLRQQVDLLISSHDRAGSFIESPPYGVGTEDSPLRQKNLDVGQMIGHYRIVSRLGAGGVGEVYLAEDIHLKRKVAVKFLLPESQEDERARKRFIREAQAAATLDHPNICAIHEVGEEDNRAFIVMQYLEGETLADRIKRKPLELPEALDVAIQVAEALSEAHSRGVIHRDLKPHNIMITARGQAKLLDFGLAKVVKEDLEPDNLETSSRLSTPGLIMGTVPYMSPEQLRGEALDARSDIFSFGTLLFEAVCGTSPFASGNHADTVLAILSKDPPALAQFAPRAPDGLQPIVNRCLDKDRRRRYQTMLDVGADLRKIRDECEAGRLIPNMISHYQIIKRLGHGTRAEVHLAEDTRSNRKVAIKVLHQDALPDEGAKRRLMREATAAAGLDHPNICAIHEVGQDSGLIFVAMQYVEGETLASLIQNKRLRSQESIDIAIQIGEALAEAHAHAIVHHHITPANIMVTTGGQVKLLGFGLGRVVGDRRSTHSETDTEILESQTGTVPRAAPLTSPNLANDGLLDWRCDILSFGAVLYEMTTGTAPSDTGHIADAGPIREALPSPRKLNPALPVRMERIIYKAFEESPNLGYQSVEQMLKDLRRVKRAGVLSATRAPRPATVALAVLLVIVIVLAAVPPTRHALERWLGAAKVPEQKHLAVLPFTNVGHDPANEIFCDGLAETLTSKLTQLEQFQGSLWVVPTSELRTRKVTSAEGARREFGVTLAISGSSQRDGDKVRLTLNLVDARAPRQLNSAVVDDSLANLLILENWLVTKSAQMLSLELRPQMLDVLAVGRTRVSAAYDAYLQGRGALQDYSQLPRIDSAIESFNQALKYDDEYALAYAGLGEAYWRRYQFTKDSQWVGPARTNCERAAELNNQISPVYVTLGIIHDGTGEYEQALKEFRRALELDPLSASAYNGLAQAYDHMGNGVLAEITYKRAIELQPDYFASYNQLGRFYFSHGRYVDAIAPWSRVVDLTPDSYRAVNNLGLPYFRLERWADAEALFESSLKLEPNYGAYSNLGSVYFHKGRYSDAALMFEKALASDSRDYKVVGNLASAYHWIPNEELAEANYRRAVQMAEAKLRVNPNDADVLSDLAVYHGMIGDRARALELIERALEQSPDDVDVLFRAGEVYEHLGDREKALRSIGTALDHGCSKAQIEEEPGLRDLRGDSHFSALIQSHQH